MTEETKQIQAVYGSNDIADVLEIQESTLRKYCLLLKKSSYPPRHLTPLQRFEVGACVCLNQTVFLPSHQPRWEPLLLLKKNKLMLYLFWGSK